MSLHPDFRDLLSAFADARVRYLVLTRVSGAEFDAAYPKRVEAEWDGVPVSVIGIDDLIATKRAAGRDRDLLDAGDLERERPRGD